MFQEQKSAPELPPCAVCKTPAEDGFWGTWLCADCYGAWTRESPRMAELEMAHADAHPADVVSRGEFQHHDAARKDNRWVVLTMDATLRVAKEAARRWVLDRRKARVGISVVQPEAFV